MTRVVRKSLPAAEAEKVTQEHNRPQRLLDIFRQLQSGEISEEEAVRALEVRRKQRYGRVGQLVEAITS